MKKEKHVFWKALVLTAVVFLLGIFLGIAYEGNKLGEITGYYALSEISLMDAFVQNNVLDTSSSCEELVNSHISFADRIYDEAFLLEKYDESGKLSDDYILAHRRYDLLRILLWDSAENTIEKCGNVSVVVYLYEYQTEDLVQKAEQSVWSRILFDLKQKKGDEIILIPIAADSNLASLDSMTEKFRIEEYPVVIIDNKEVVYELSSVEEIEAFLE